MTEATDNAIRNSQEVKASETVLIQFQCQEEGSLFYYQHTLGYARMLVEFCPVCGSWPAMPTGRVYDAIDQKVTTDAKP